MLEAEDIDSYHGTQPCYRCDQDGTAEKPSVIIGTVVFCRTHASEQHPSQRDLIQEAHEHAIPQQEPVTK
jgi:hypothetical protein